MLKGLGDMGNIMKLQKEMKNVQKRLKSTRMEGESPDGSVKTVVNGEYQLVDIKINNDFLANHESEKIEKMILDAVNDAVTKIKKYSITEMSKLTGGLNLPGLLG